MRAIAPLRITLPDGYQGHMACFCLKPLAVDGPVVKLPCAEPGKEYMFRWVSIAELARRIEMVGLDGLQERC